MHACESYGGNNEQLATHFYVLPMNAPSVTEFKFTTVHMTNTSTGIIFNVLQKDSLENIAVGRL